MGEIEDEYRRERARVCGRRCLAWCWMAQPTSATWNRNTTSSCPATRASRRWRASCSRPCSVFLGPATALSLKGGATRSSSMDGLRVDSVKIDAAAAAIERTGHGGILVLRYLFTRLLYMLPVIWLVVSVVFL